MAPQAYTSADDLHPGCPVRNWYEGVADRIGPAVAESNGRKGGAARREGEAMPESIRGAVDDCPALVAIRSKTTLLCPSCGSLHVAQVLGDNGGVSYVCTACGHSWS
ncbi:hypothetical protein SGFS_077050 [Streptomyces graminofaciens]|uniref:Uncharacterized protein n=1 Tax=Streptomyces graminofaciens TaxID=68212 RepID=A0ABN5VTB0_9ACTN|nr:hypothetical protein SGFS_077050 [Streptomyces graminofaciens]